MVFFFVEGIMFYIGRVGLKCLFSILGFLVEIYVWKNGGNFGNIYEHVHYTGWGRAEVDPTLSLVEYSPSSPLKK